MNRKLQNTNITEVSAVVMAVVFVEELIEQMKKYFFSVPMMKHYATNLFPIVQVFIRPESITISNKWGACNNVDELDHAHEHQTVNHSKNFLDPITSTCKNRIESKWFKLKQKIPNRRCSFDKVSDEILI